MLVTVYFSHNDHTRGYRVIPDMASGMSGSTSGPEWIQCARLPRIIIFGNMPISMSRC